MAVTVTVTVSFIEVDREAWCKNERMTGVVSREQKRRSHQENEKRRGREGETGREIRKGSQSNGTRQACVDEVPFDHTAGAFAGGACRGWHAVLANRILLPESKVPSVYGAPAEAHDNSRHRNKTTAPPPNQSTATRKSTETLVRAHPASFWILYEFGKHDTPSRRLMKDAARRIHLCHVRLYNVGA